MKIFFQDLSLEVQEEVWQETKEKLHDEIMETITENPHLDPQTVENEVIDHYINCHNFAIDISY